MTNPVTPALFRTSFPEFTSVVIYPDSMVQFWLDVATKQVRPQVWGNQLNLGIELYAAHNIILEQQAARAALTSGVPGLSSGPINNKSVDKVSVGYDSAVASEEKAGNWNLTTYGVRYYRMAQLFGSGGIQLGVGCYSGSVDYSI